MEDFVRSLEVDVVESTNPADANTISLSIDRDGDGVNYSPYDLGSIEFKDSGMVDGSRYNAVKMKDRIEDVLAQFVSSDSDNAHVLEQFFGMDSLTAAELAALERAVAAGEQAADNGATQSEAVSAISNSLSTESSEVQSSEAVQAVQTALTSQQVTNAVTAVEVVAAVKEVVADIVDESLAATEMDTLPVRLRLRRFAKARRTEVIVDRDKALADIANQRPAEQGAKREELLGKTTVDRMLNPLLRLNLVNRTRLLC